MADFFELRALIESARAFDEVFDGARFHMKLPSEFDMRKAAEDHRDVNGLIKEAQMFRPLIESCLTGWDGVTQAHIAPGLPATAVPFSPEARTLLLEHNMAVADTLAMAMARRARERREQREADAKNLKPAPNGT